MLRIFLIILIILSIGCSNEDADKIIQPTDLFKSSIKLNHTTLPVDSDSLTYVYDIKVLDSIIILSDPNSAYHFSVIDRNKFQVKGRFGKIGNGPGEINFPSTLHLKYNSNDIEINNRNKFSIVKAKLNNQYTYNPDSIVKFGPFDTNYQQIISVDSDHFLGVGLFNNRFILSNGKGDILSGFMEYPFHSKHYKHVSYQIMAMAQQGKFERNESRFAFAVSNSPILEIFEYKNDSLMPISSLESWPPLLKDYEDDKVISATLDKDNLYGYLDMTSSNDYIFVLYSGESYNSTDDPYESNKVLVFDWDGNPISFIELDAKVRFIGVDRNNKTLICFRDLKNPELIKYEINL